MGCAISNQGKNLNPEIKFWDPFSGEKENDEKFCEELEIGDRVHVRKLEQMGFLSNVKGDTFYVQLDNGLELGFVRKYLGKVDSTAENLKHALKTPAKNALLRWLENGGDPNARNSKRTPLIHLMVQRKEWFLLEKIVSLGVDVDLHNHRKMTPLHLACANGDSDSAAMLLDLGAAVNAICVGGATPLHFACNHADPSFILLMVEHGADVNRTDWTGRTPLDYALGTCDDAFVQFFTKLEGVDTAQATRYRAHYWESKEIPERRPTQEGKRFTFSPSGFRRSRSNSAFSFQGLEAAVGPRGKAAKASAKGLGSGGDSSNGSTPTHSRSRSNSLQPDHRTKTKRKNLAQDVYHNFVDTTLNRERVEEEKVAMELDPTNDRPTPTFRRSKRRIDWSEAQVDLTYQGHYRAGDYVSVDVTIGGLEQLKGEGIVTEHDATCCKVVLDQKYQNHLHGPGMSVRKVAEKIDIENIRFEPLSIRGLTTALSIGLQSTVDQWLKSPGFHDLNEPEFVTIAHWAAERGYTETLDFLGNHSVNLNCVDNRGRTILHRAAFAGRVDVLRHVVHINYSLLGHSINFEARDENGCNLIHYAVQGKHLNTLEYIMGEVKIHQFLDVDHQNLQGYTPLHLAAVNGKLDIVKYLVEVQNANTEICCLDGFTPHTLAVKEKNENVAEFLATCRAKKKTSFLQKLSSTFSNNEHALHNHSTKVHKMGYSSTLLKKKTSSDTTSEFGRISEGSQKSLSTDTVKQVDLSHSASFLGLVKQHSSRNPTTVAKD